MRKFLSIALIGLCAMCSFTSCNKAAPDAGQEGVFIMKPVFASGGGVDPEPVSCGLEWCAPTTDVVYYNIQPQRFEVKMGDLASNDNTLLDFNTVIVVQAIKGKTPILHENYGQNWFKNILESYFRKRVLNYVSQYDPFDLMSNREILDKIDRMTLKDMRDYVARLSKDREFPVTINEVIIGKATPNKPQLDEMNETARQIQAKQTQDKRVEVEKAREKAEVQRALADKAYQKEMGLTPSQFITLKAWEIIAKKPGANIDVMFNDNGATNKMWHINKDK